MKKILLSFLIILTFSINSYSQSTGDQMNAVLEYCTGTWCQYCPCGHVIIDGILSNYPNTVVLAYHGGGGGDPWLTPSAGMIGLFGFNLYPTGVVSRKSGIIDRSAWNNKVVLTSFQTPGVNIEISNKNYNSATRLFSCNVKMTARAMLDGNFSANFILTEDNLVYSQTGNSGCIGNSSYHHEHVVKAMINGDLGETVVTSGHWMTGESVTKNISYTLPAGITPENANINIFVYKVGTAIATDYDIQQSIHFPVSNATGIENPNSLVSDYSLSQNYPNPFNPVTNIRYSIPKDGIVSFKVYDILGNEVAQYVNGFQKTGTYTVLVDGANLSSGIYYYKLEANGFTDTKKMMLVK